MLLGIEWDVCFSVSMLFIAPATCNGGSHDTYNNYLGLEVPHHNDSTLCGLQAITPVEGPHLSRTSKSSIWSPFHP